MDVIFLLIGFSLFVALLFLASFIWAVRNGQFDDMHTPAMRLLFDNPPKMSGREKTGTKKEPGEEPGTNAHPHEMNSK